MLYKIVMPELGQTVTEAVIDRWHKAEGDAVKKGEILLEITTDKASLEVEAFYDGTLLKIVHPAKATVEVGRAIAVIGDAGEKIPADFLKEEPRPAKPAAPAAAPAASAPRPVPGAAPSQAPAAPAPVPVPAAHGRIFVSPRAKRLAEENKVCLELLTGSGPDGRIVEADVQARLAKIAGIDITPAAAALAFERKVDIAAVKGTGPAGRIVREDVETAVPAVAERIPLSRIQAITAERMTWSFMNIPQFSLTFEFNMKKATALVQKKKKQKTSSVTMTAVLVKAVSAALQEYPGMGAVYDNGGLLAMRGVNIGVAVGLESGELIVPVIRNTETMDLEQVGVAARDIIGRARKKKLLPDEMTGGVITISNLGMFGVDAFVPIVNPGESSILGVGTIKEQPVIAGAKVSKAPIMKVTIACDHRAVNGVLAAQFMAYMREVVEGAAF